MWAIRNSRTCVSKRSDALLGRIRRAAPFALALSVAALPAASRAGLVDPQLAAQIERTRQLGPRPLGIIVELEGRPEVAVLERAIAALPESARPGALAAQLRPAFERQAAPARAALAQLGANDIESLWLAHALAAVVAPNVVKQIAQTPGVARVYSDVALKAPSLRLPTTAEALRARRQADAGRRPAEPQSVAPTGTDFDALNWRGPLPNHLSAIGASEWWQRGVAGREVTVAVIDSGVDGRDPLLRASFRGGARDWFDPFAQRSIPHDGSNHGSHVARLIAGGAAQGSSDAPLGVAPHARWIAARIYDDAGVGKLSAIHRIHQWLLDPDGRPETADAPLIVNNSWALPQSVGRCDREFERDFAVLRAARIHVLFAAGNEGPAENTSVSPSNNAGVIAVGAIGSDGSVAPASSRGPSACTGGAYPQLLAPGMALQSQDVAARIVGASDPVSGTSYSVALASGLLALIASEDRSASFSEREQRLAGALARGRADRASGPVELAWSPRRATDGSVAIDAAALRDVLPWNARVTDVALDEPGGAAGKVAVEQARVRAIDAGGVPPFALLARAEDGRRWRVAVTPQAPEEVAASEAKRLTMAVASGGTAMLEVSQLAAALTQKSDKPITVRASQSSRGAQVIVRPDGAVQYTARRGFRGVDHFVCDVSAGGAPAERIAVSVYVN